MAKGKIPIKEGERLSKEYDAPVVIVFSIHDRGDSFNVMTYGANRKLCRHAASLGDQIARKVLEGEIAPEQTHLPEMPANWESTASDPDTRYMLSILERLVGYEGHEHFDGYDVTMAEARNLVEKMKKTSRNSTEVSP
jgi:hypothetical protein